jgi:type I restriction enzyme R subunit
MPTVLWCASTRTRNNSPPRSRACRRRSSSLSEIGYDPGVLVAFSGTITVDGVDYTEPSVNGFPDSQTARKFDTDDYHILIVAEKFQTGFDQPLLHAMYVDKPLNGLAAVQTLSRLNRQHKDKDDTFVLDFANTTDDIAAAFQPFYGKTMAITDWCRQDRLRADGTGVGRG